MLRHSRERAESPVGYINCAKQTARLVFQENVRKLQVISVTWTRGFTTYLTNTNVLQL
jgi:hypothetical protein